MYNHPHHQQIEKILSGMNLSILEDCQLWFGGGTCIVMQNEEYRKSVDVDFLCSETDGYRNLRQEVFDHGLRRIFSSDVSFLREHRADQYGVRGVISIDGETPIKFEFVREARIDLASEWVFDIPVKCVSRSDLFVEKLLANADRGMDSATLHRDILDFLVMKNRWGGVPLESLEKATQAYGNSVEQSLFCVAKKTIQRKGAGRTLYERTGFF